jgi:hypothetical protein
MSEIPDYERIHDLMQRFDEVRTDAQEIRARIRSLELATLEWPSSRDIAAMFADLLPSSDDGPPHNHK